MPKHPLFILAMAMLACTTLPVRDAASENLEEVTTCGQVLVESGYLSADLDCSAVQNSSSTVTLGPSARLELRGFTLTSQTNPNEAPTVDCDRNCRIVGPGTIVGSSTGISAVIGRGMSEPTSVTVEGATIRDGHVGIYARKVSVTDSIVRDHRSAGIASIRGTLVRSTLTGNGMEGLNFAAFYSHKSATVIDSTVTLNGVAGINAARIKVENSVVTGNTQNANCVMYVCADIASRKRPRFSASSCETSLSESEPGGVRKIQSTRTSFTDPTTHNWSICEFD